MNHTANRPAVSAAMKEFKAKMEQLGMVPSHQGARKAWHRKGAGGMSVIAFNAIDPTDAEFKHPVRIAIALDSGQGEILVSQAITYPSSAKVILERLVEISDAMHYHRPEEIEGYQPTSQLFLLEDDGFYVGVTRSEMLDDRPLFTANRRDLSEGSLERLGESPELHKAFVMVNEARQNLVPVGPMPGR
jgi:hypothetical protein